MSHPSVFTPRRPVGNPSSSAADRESRAADDPLQAREKKGKVLVVAGWITAMVGVVVYCVASFAAGSDAGLAEILRGEVPAAVSGLIVIGGGTLMWIAGSVMHLDAELDAAERPDAPEEASTDQSSNR